MKTWIRNISGRAVVAACFLVGLTFSPAKGIELITQETFDAEKSTYKAYPFNILFKKLAESTGAEKRQIKNLIVLKQVFDPNMQAKEKAGLLTYHRTAGIIKTLDNEKAKIFSVETGQGVEFYVGIDRVPLQNLNAYTVTGQNIGQYASIVYTLDNRIYRVEVSFLIAEPQELSLKRENDNNRISWRQPETTQKPYGYTVLINDKPYQTVEGTTAAVPRIRGQVDAYRVSAVYSHGKGRIESDASPPLQDTITMAEMEQERLALATFAQVLVGLKPGQWETARGQLYASQGLFAANLTSPQREQVTGLTGFFKTVEEGDRVLGKAPQTVAGTDQALAVYGRAGQQAAGLSPGIEVGFIVTEKTAAATELQAALKTQRQQELAAAMYAQVVAGLKPGQWETARSRLYASQGLFAANLISLQREQVTGLTAFFKTLEEGDRQLGKAPQTEEGIGQALAVYGRAGEQAAGLSPGIEVGFIVTEKTAAATELQAALKTQQQQALAAATFARVLAGLKPGQWETARGQLYASQGLFTANLTSPQREQMTGLTGFFKTLEEGDLVLGKAPQTIAGTDQALAVYGRAGEQAAGLSPGIDVGFIVKEKTAAANERQAALKTQQQQALAAATFAQVLAGLKPGQWETARGQLYASQGLFAANLTSPQREQVTGLTAFFKTLEEGDRQLGKAPQTEEGIGQALAAYGRAGEQAAGLSPGIDVGFIVKEKTAAANERQAALKTQQQQALAAAQQPIAVPAPPPAPVEAAPPPLPVDRNAEIKQALGRFDEKNYTEALNHFTAVYSSQINNLQQRDQRQVKGLLSLPPKYRAEIIFLIEFERIRKKNNDDRDRIKMGLEDLLQDIENRQGPWVLIPEIRRERIKKHINEFQ